MARSPLILARPLVMWHRFQKRLAVSEMERFWTTHDNSAGESRRHHHYIFASVLLLIAYRKHEARQRARYETFARAADLDGWFTRNQDVIAYVSMKVNDLNQDSLISHRRSSSLLSLTTQKQSRPSAHECTATSIDSVSVSDPLSAPLSSGT